MNNITCTYYEIPEMNQILILISIEINFNSFPTLAVTCLLITFANSLDPYQNRQNVSRDLDLNHLTLI